MQFLLNYVTNMSTITKKQTALALVAVVFATAMIAGTFVVSDQSAFARNHITVASHQHQHATVQTAGGASTITASGNNAQTSTNTNTGGSIS
jgi:ABC-type bacteriocin/lantibiotic exporter with double-glycine peptidase domain